MNQAITLALGEEMRADPRVVLIGEDVGLAGGVFRTSDGLLTEFGATRVRDTPISEMGFLGIGVGAAATGLRPVVEIMFADFLAVALDQLANQAAKLHFLSGGELTVPLVVRTSTGAGLGFGAQHSQTVETWLYGMPGLKVAVASGARTAYGLIRAAIRDNGPVVIMEPRALYGAREEFEPSEDAVIPLGKAEMRASGSDVTVVAIGRMVQVALDVASRPGNWSADVIDLRTLVPWDRDLVFESVSRTSRLVLVEESPHSGGWGTEIVSAVSTELINNLEAPPLRITAPDVPVPYAKDLEERYAPNVDYVAKQIDHLINTATAPRPWWEHEGILA